MEIQRREQGIFTIFSLAGDLDANTCSSLEKSLSEEMVQWHIQLILDLAKVNYVSSAGMRSILAVVKEARKMEAICGVRQSKRTSLRFLN